MPTTLTNEIYYPDGSTVPNVPVAMQAQAESTDQALSRISEAPFIVCGKAAPQSTGAATMAYGSVTWDREVWKQGITHSITKDTDQFIIEEPGLYSLIAKVPLSYADTTGSVIISVNGIDQQNTAVDASGVTTANAATWPKPTTITDLKLAAGDVVRVRTRASRPNLPLVSEEAFFSMRKSSGFAK